MRQFIPYIIVVVLCVTCYVWGCSNARTRTINHTTVRYRDTAVFLPSKPVVVLRDIPVRITIHDTIRGSIVRDTLRLPGIIAATNDTISGDTITGRGWYVNDTRPVLPMKYPLFRLFGGAHVTVGQNVGVGIDATLHVRNKFTVGYGYTLPQQNHTVRVELNLFK